MPDYQEHLKTNTAIVMTDSGAFTNLSDLINSHLSKTELKSSPTAKSLNVIIGSSRQDRRTNADISTTTSRDSSIGFKEPPDVGAFSSIFGSARQEERKKESEELDCEEITDCEDIIDLMKCLTTVPAVPRMPRKVSESSDEIDFKLSFDADDADITEPMANIEVTNYTKLRCILDEYRKPAQITCKGKVKKPKCSSIGKAICTRYIEMLEPYWIDEIVSCVSRFNFDAKSPDDVVKDGLKKTRTNSGSFVKAS